MVNLGVKGEIVIVDRAEEEKKREKRWATEQEDEDGCENEYKGDSESSTTESDSGSYQPSENRRS